MRANAFAGRKEEPDGATVRSVLGTKQKLWDRTVQELMRAGLADSGEWHSYSVKAGWAFRLQKGKRNVAYLVPHEGAFTVSLVLGGKAIEAARAMGLPAEAIALIDGAKKYAEGTAVPVEVAGERDVATVRQLVECKLRF